MEYCKKLEKENIMKTKRKEKKEIRGSWEKESFTKKWRVES